uniref:Uncharacterized protein n=1 Tax=Schistosoma japonicum TaxID=6182 RepID=C1LMT7_SCHJA|nr:hypothetical protein [Schistosoma japonicum]CAX76015.1 hypothetical protein [Schistosoma japonicum]
MLAAMSSHRNQMNSLLYWLIPSMIYFNILYLDNSVASEEYYVVSESKHSYEAKDFPFFNITSESRLLIKQIGFVVEVHQFQFQSAIVFRNESTVYMADTFEQDNPMRSFKIVGNSLNVDWAHMHYCESHNETYADLFVDFYATGAIIFNIDWVNKPDKNCDMTFEIADGKYEGSKDGSGEIVNEKVIFKKVIPGSSIFDDAQFIFNPQPTCQEHITEDACETYSSGKPECMWCPKCPKCLRKESPFSVSDQTETTESQPLKIESSINYHIVFGCALIVLIIFGMIACT